MFSDHPTPSYVIHQADEYSKQGLLPAHLVTGEWEFAARYKRLRDLVAQNKEIRALYAKIGYSVDVVEPQAVERQAKELVDSLKALIRTKILNFAAFQKALAKVQTKVQQQEREVDDDLVSEAEGADLYDFLILPLSALEQDSVDKLIAVQDDHGKMLQLLNEDPLFPWRLPFYLYHFFLRPRIMDPVRFAELLDKLKRLFKAPGILQSEVVRRQVLDDITQVWRDRKAGGDILGSLDSLISHISQVHSACKYLGYVAYDETIRKKKGQLDDILWQLWDKRTGLNNPNYPNFFYDFRRTAQECAKEYLDASWMHTPWLTTYVLTNLLDADIALLTRKIWPAREIWPEPPRLRWGKIFSWLEFWLFVCIQANGVVGWYCSHPFVYPQLKLIVRVLSRIIREEIVSGRYDGEETARRLRRFEKRGVYIDSFIYSLLRLNTSASLPSAGPV